MSLKSLQIGKHTIKYPIFQGGMGLGINGINWLQQCH